jgi:transposase
MSKLNHTDTSAAAEYATVYVAFELSKAKWHLGVILPASQKLSRFRIDGGDLAALSGHLANWRAKAGAAGKPVRIVSCYEAGYDGHWLHRWLTSQGVINYEIDPASIQVNRRARRPKTDRIDLEQLMSTLLRYLRGEPRVCSMVRVPSPEDEDRRRASRERDRLLKERSGHSNRITGLLHAQGIRDAKPFQRGFIASLESMRTGDGRVLPPKLKEEIVREHERLCLVQQHLTALEAKSRAEMRAPARGSIEEKINHLVDLRGHRGGGRTQADARGVLPLVRQSPPGRQFCRADQFRLRQWEQPSRSRHQQSGQPARPHAGDRARLVVAALPARERAEPLVPRAGR